MFMGLRGRSERSSLAECKASHTGAVLGPAESYVRVIQLAKRWNSGLCEKLPGGGVTRYGECVLVRDENLRRD